MYLDWKSFRHLGKNTSSGLSKRHSTCPGERVDDTFWKKTHGFCCRSQTLSSNISDFWQNNFSSFAKMEFYVSQGTFWGIFSGKTLYNFYSFQTVSKKHSHFPQKFPAGISNRPSTSPREFFEVLFGEILFALHHFRTMRKKKQITFDGKVTIGLWKCNESWGTFWGETFFLRKLKLFFRLPHFERILFGLLAKTIQQCCQNRSLRLQRKVLMIFFAK